MSHKQKREFHLAAFYDTLDEITKARIRADINARFNKSLADTQEEFVVVVEGGSLDRVIKKKVHSVTE